MWSPDVQQQYSDIHHNLCYLLHALHITTIWCFYLFIYFSQFCGKTGGWDPDFNTVTVISNNNSNSNGRSNISNSNVIVTVVVTVNNNSAKKLFIHLSANYQKKLIVCCELNVQNNFDI